MMNPKDKVVLEVIKKVHQRLGSYQPEEAR